jgi:hypothetical protein
MWKMNKVLRLVIVTTLGVTFMSLLAAGVYAGRYVLTLYGFNMSQQTFQLVLSIVLGGGFGFASRLILRELGEKPGGRSGEDKKRK